MVWTYCSWYWTYLDDNYSLCSKICTNDCLCFCNHRINRPWCFIISLRRRVIHLINLRWWTGGNSIKIITAVVCFLLAILLLVMICMYSSEVKFQGIMLEYAVRFLNENPFTFSYIPLYLIFTAGLFALILWQAACFSSSWGKLSFLSGGVWGVLNILEFIWGLQFLRDSCNFSFYI